MSAFPLPPGYECVRRRTRWVYRDARGQRVSWARRDTRAMRILVWELWLGWHGG